MSATTLQPVATQAGSQVLRRPLLITLLTVLFYYYPSLLATTLSLFACYTLDRVTPLKPLKNARVSRTQCCCIHTTQRRACAGCQLYTVLSGYLDYRVQLPATCSFLRSPSKGLVMSCHAWQGSTAELIDTCQGRVVEPE